MYICVVYHSKSLQRVYCGIDLATLFGENSQNVKQKGFSINFCCNTLLIMFIAYLEQKTMRTNIKNIFFSSVPKNYGKNSKKNDAKYSWAL